MRGVANENTMVLVVFAFPVMVPGQNAPTQAFQQWARQHVHTILSVDMDTHDDADLQTLGNIIGSAHVVAFGEPFHQGHEPLAMRNRLIRYAVTRFGFTAVALETGLTTSKLLYDHVLGKTTERESALKEAFSYGFGNLPENLALIRWLRSYNATQPPERRVRLYGIDLTGQEFPYAYRSVEAVLTFLEHADPDLGRELRKQCADVIPVFRSDKYVKLTPAEKDAITGKIQDMVALIRRERIPLTAATSRDDYEWALRQALNAAQDDAFLRSHPQFEFELLLKSPEKFPPTEWEHNLEMRDLAMADNLQWVQQREGARGKILFFAHDGHVQTSLLISPSRPVTPPLQPYLRWRPAGMYLRSALDRDMVVIGTYFGHGTGFPADRAPLPPDTAGMDSLLSVCKKISVAIKPFLA
jgi:erythromycin esterase